MLYGISGFKGSGKDTIADFLVEKHGFVKVSFADKLKDACATIFEWDREMLEGSTEESRKWREEVDEWWADRLGVEDFSPRLALQWMGTEAGRNVFGANIWCAAMEKFILENPANYVIPDVRFANEVKMIKNMRGTMCRVIRGPEPDWYKHALEWNGVADLDKSHMVFPAKLNDIHPSEREWIGSKFDHEFENNDTVKDLHNLVETAFGLVDEEEPIDPQLNLELSEEVAQV